MALLLFDLDKDYDRLEQEFFPTEVQIEEALEVKSSSYVINLLLVAMNLPVLFWQLSICNPLGHQICAKELRQSLSCMKYPNNTDE